MDYDIQVADIDEQATAVVRGHVAHDGISEFLGVALGEVMGAVGHVACGPPFARYGMTDDGWDIEAGVPVSGAFEPRGRVEASGLPGGQAARTEHVGPYQDLGGAYRAIEKWLGTNGLRPSGSPWEVYLNDPHAGETPRTLVVWPCATA